MLGEVSTAELSKKHKPKTFDQNKIIANKGGGVAGIARENLEKKLGKGIVSPLNTKSLKEKND